MAKAIENTFHGDQEVELVDLPCRSPSTTASQSSNSPPSDDGTDSSSETVVEEEQPVANHDASHTTPRIFDRLAKLRSNGRSILKTATFSVTAFTGIFGLGYYSYRADVLARWTATKEFWILCRDLEAANQAFPTCDKYKGKAMPEPPFGPAAFTSKLKMKRTPSIPVASINLLKDVDTSNPREAALALARSKTFQFSGFLRQVGTHDEIDSKDHQELDEYEGNPILPIRYQKDVAEICCGTTRRRFSKRRPWNTAFTWNKPFAYTDSKALISYEGCEKLCGNSYLKDTRERSNLSSGIMILLFFFCLYVSWRSVTYQTKPRICKDERDLATSVAVKNISLRSNKKLKTEVQGNTRKRKNTST